MSDPRSLRVSRQDGAAIATGFATADVATPELVDLAVREALAGAGRSLAGSVLLFLTPHFSRNAAAAVAAAARAACCLQVSGCCAPGVFTERQWSLDAPAAAALVLAGDIGLVHPDGQLPTLTLTTAAAARGSWLRGGPPRVGMVSTDADADRDGRVWSGGKVAADGRCEAAFGGARAGIAVSRGLRAMSPTLMLDEVDGHEVFAVSGKPAYASLMAALPPALADSGHPPLSQVFAALPRGAKGADAAIADGDYGVVPIVAASPDEQSVTLAAALDPGDRIFWALRQPMAAEADTGNALSALAAAVPSPAFAVMFACIGRGPYFFAGEDRDRGLISERFPGLPIIGAYGAGEIAPQATGNALVSYSAVVALIGDVRT